MNKNKKLLVLVICICILLSGVVLTSVHAVGPTLRIARIIVLASINGSNITLSNGGPRTFTPREGQRLSNGSVVSTGQNTSAQFRLDEASRLQMDEESQVQVSSSGSRLVLSLQRGHALVHVPNQVEGRDIECRVGSTGLVVRGTMFVIGHWDDIVTIVMLSGSGDVYSGGEVINLPAGSMMWVFDENHEPEDVHDLARVNHYYLEQGHALITRMRPEYMNMFTLRAVYDNQDYLLEAGTVCAEMIEEIARILGRETVARRPAPGPTEQPAPGVTPGPLPTPTPTPAPTPTPIPTTPPVITPAGLSLSA